MNRSNKFKTVIAIVLLVSSIIILVARLFNPQPIQIVLETGQEVASANASYFTIGTVTLLIVCAFIIGATIMYLFYDSDLSEKGERKNIVTGDYLAHANAHTPETSPGGHASDTGHDHYDLIMPLLREDEKKAVRLLRERDGEMLQNELVLKLGLSKVKTTRILAGLERKDIITKQRHGLTNSIRLRH